MAPKSQPTKTGTKRPRGKFAASSSTPQPYDASRFPTLGQYERFLKMDKYKIWPEKVFDILQMFTSRKWTKLISPCTKINHDLLKEFYANAVTDSSHTTMPTLFLSPLLWGGRSSASIGMQSMTSWVTLWPYLSPRNQLCPPSAPTVRKTGKEIGSFGRLRRTSFSRTEGSSRMLLVNSRKSSMLIWMPMPVWCSSS